MLEPWYGRLVSLALLSHREGENDYAGQLLPDIKRIGDVMHVLLAQRRPGLTRAESDALLVALWSMAVGYVAGNGFFCARSAVRRGQSVIASYARRSAIRCA